jgi:RNA polymerase sigma factor (sigma-70 family)
LYNRTVSYRNNPEDAVREVGNVVEDPSDARVFAAIYEQHMPGVYRYVRYRVGNVHLAEDLTSTIFEKALTNFRRYRSDRAAILTWLMTIARNTIIDHFRRQGRRQEMTLDDAGEVPSTNDSPEQEAIKKEELRRLHFCLDRLSSQEQEIVSCKFGAEMKNRQVARTLQLSESNVGTILFRAVLKLRDCFREWENGKGR